MEMKINEEKVKAFLDDWFEKMRISDEKRKEIFSLYISNPVIRNTARLYCLSLRKFASVLPTSITELIRDVLNEGKYPSWLSDVKVENVDACEKCAVWASKLKYEHSDLPTKDGLIQEIQNEFIPFLESAELWGDEQRAYTTKSMIVAIRDGDFYQVIDGARVVSKLLDESKLFGDFKINIVVIRL